MYSKCTLFSRDGKGYTELSICGNPSVLHIETASSFLKRSYFLSDSSLKEQDNYLNILWCIREGFKDKKYDRKVGEMLRKMYGSAADYVNDLDSARIFLERLLPGRNKAMPKGRYIHPELMPEKLKYKSVIIYRKESVKIHIFYNRGNIESLYFDIVFPRDGSFSHTVSFMPDCCGFRLPVIDTEKAKGTLLERFADAVNKTPESTKSYALMSMLSEPKIAEGMATVMKPLFVRYFSDYGIMFHNDFSNIFAISDRNNPALPFLEYVKIGNLQAEIMTKHIANYPYSPAPSISSLYGPLIATRRMASDLKRKYGENIITDYREMDPEILEKTCALRNRIASSMITDTQDPDKIIEAEISIFDTMETAVTVGGFDFLFNLEEIILTAARNKKMEKLFESLCGIKETQF